MAEREMTWREARDATLLKWRKVREELGRRDRLGPHDEPELLAELNAVHALCEKARADSAADLRHCPHCRFYEQYGGCREIGLQMSERVVEHDLEGLRVMVDAFLRQLERLEEPRASS